MQDEQATKTNSMPPLYKWGLIAAFVALGGIAFSGYNKLVALEERLLAQHEQTKNVYASIFNNIRSQGSVVNAYRESVLQAIDAVMSGRYGSGGVDSVLTFIREQNPQMSPDIFLKLQNAIESGYAKFERSQRIKLDIVRAYRTELRTFPTNVAAGVLGFPRSDLDALSQIVTNQATEGAFSSGMAEPIDPMAN